MPVNWEKELFERTYWKSDLPTGCSGEVKIERFEVTPLSKDELSGNTNPVTGWGKRIPGWYTRLYIGQTVMMTDLYEEWWSQRHAIREAYNRGGHVLISGLGIGLIIDALLKPPRTTVQKVTVLEQNEHVIQLVAEHFFQKYPDKLSIIHTDALTWTPPDPSHYQVVWHDIWPYPRMVPTEEIDRLRKKFSSCSDWQGFWTIESFAE